MARNGLPSPPDKFFGRVIRLQQHYRLTLNSHLPLVLFSLALRLGSSGGWRVPRKDGFSLASRVPALIVDGHLVISSWRTICMTNGCASHCRHRGEATRGRQVDVVVVRRRMRHTTRCTIRTIARTHHHRRDYHRRTRALLLIDRRTPLIRRTHVWEDSEEEETGQSKGEGEGWGGEGKAEGNAERGGGAKEGEHETNRSAHARHPAFTFLGRRVSRATRCLNLATRHTDKHTRSLCETVRATCTHRRRRRRRKISSLQEEPVAILASCRRGDNKHDDDDAVAVVRQEESDLDDTRGREGR